MLIISLTFLFALLLLVGICLTLRTFLRQSKERTQPDRKHRDSGIFSFFYENVVLRKTRNTNSLLCRVVKNPPRDGCAPNISPPVTRYDSPTAGIPHCSPDPFREWAVGKWWFFCSATPMIICPWLKDQRNIRGVVLLRCYWRVLVLVADRGLLRCAHFR